MKKIVSFIFVALLMVIPFLNTQISASELNSAFNMEAGENTNTSDYVLGSDSVTINVTYDSDKSTYDKQMVFTLPKEMRMGLLPVVDGMSITDATTEPQSDGTTKLYVTIPAQDAGILKKFSFNVGLNAQLLSSNDEVQIDGEYYLLNEEGEKDDTISSKTDSVQIKIHDYKTDGKMYTKTSTNLNDYYVDRPIDIRTTFVWRGEGSSFDFPTYSSGYSLNFTNIKLDISKFKYKLPSGEEGYVGDKLEYIDVSESSSYTYDPTTGIFTIKDVLNAENDYHSNFGVKISFLSEFFEDGTIINSNHSESLTFNMSEVNGNDLTSLVELRDTTFKLVDTEYVAEVGVRSFVSTDSSVIDLHDSKLFRTEIVNKNHDVKNINYNINIPDGVKITAFQAPGKRFNYGNITITDENGNQTVAGGTKKALSEEITGPTTINVKIDNIPAGYGIEADPAQQYNQAYGIGFYGEIQGNEGDKYTFDIDKDSIYADVYDVDGVLQETGVKFGDLVATNNSYTLNGVAKTSLSITHTGLFISPRDQENPISGLSKVTPGQRITLNASARVEFYGFDAYNPNYYDPLIYINVPNEILPKGKDFDINDFRVYSKGYGTDFTDKIKNIQVVDTEAVLPNGESSTLVAIEMEGHIVGRDYAGGAFYELRVQMDGLINPEINETKNITFNIGTMGYGTTDTTHYTERVSSMVARSENIYGADLSSTTALAVNGSSSNIEVFVAEELTGQSYVDTDYSGTFYSIDDTYGDEDLPEYRLGTDGKFKFTMQNRTSKAYNDVASYFVLPKDEPNLRIVIDETSIEKDPNITIYYTSDEITDPTDWITSSTKATTWSEKVPSDGVVTAVKLVSSNIDAKTDQEVLVSYTSEYLEKEDTVTYGTKRDGRTLYNLDSNNVSNGDRAAFKLIKTEAPTLTTNMSTEYTRNDIDMFKNELASYIVTDDYSTKTKDIDKNLTLITITSIDGTTKTYTYNEFMSKTDIEIGDYSIKYVTDKDADAQQTTVTVETKVVGDVEIEAKDYEVYLPDAPTIKDVILEKMLVSAKDFDLKDLSDIVEISDLGGYDLNNPKVGEYKIEFTVTGNRGNTATTSATLTVLDEDVVEQTPEVEEEDETSLSQTGFDNYIYVSITLAFIIILSIIVRNKIKK